LRGTFLLFIFLLRPRRESSTSPFPPSPPGVLEARRVNTEGQGVSPLPPFSSLFEVGATVVPFPPFLSPPGQKCLVSPRDCLHPSVFKKSPDNIVFPPFLFLPRLDPLIFLLPIAGEGIEEGTARIFFPSFSPLLCINAPSLTFVPSSQSRRENPLLAAVETELYSTPFFFVEGRLFPFWSCFGFTSRRFRRGDGHFPSPPLFCATPYLWWRPKTFFFSGRNDMKVPQSTVDSPPYPSLLSFLSFQPLNPFPFPPPSDAR